MRLVLILLCSLFSIAALADKKAILAELVKHKELNGCYSESGITKKGKIVIDFTVDAKGEVPEAKANIKSTLRDLGVIVCLTTRIKDIKFPPAPASKTIPVSYAFDFSK